MSTDIKWAAELAHVREVSLLGSADLAYWADRLRREELTPADHGGRAGVMIIAADAKFMGVRFREVSFSIVVRREGAAAAGAQGAFLGHAWNSFRPFAFCERFFFSTPYSHGDVQVSAADPASVELCERGKIVFRAEMRPAAGGGPNREASSHGAGGWDGPVYLPGKGAATGRRGRLFFARLAGDTVAYPFSAAADSVTLNPARASDMPTALIDSHFTAEQWHVRADATHAKSKTYARADRIGA